MRMEETSFRKAGEASRDEKQIDYPAPTSDEAEHPSLLLAGYRFLCVFLLLLSYFLSQYDK